MLRYAFLIAAGLSCAASVASAEPFKVDLSHTQVLFYINHFGFSEVGGRFNSFDAKLDLDETAPEKSSVQFTIRADSVDTGFGPRDAVLKKPEFLDAERFPTITFVSNKVELTGKTTAKVFGDMTMHGVTKPAEFDVTLNKLGPHPINKKKAAGFTAVGTIKRSDFGVSYLAPAIADEVLVTVSAEAAADEGS